MKKKILKKEEYALFLIVIFAAFDYAICFSLIRTLSWSLIMPAKLTAAAATSTMKKNS